MADGTELMRSACATASTAAREYRCAPCPEADERGVVGAGARPEGGKGDREAGGGAVRGEGERHERGPPREQDISLRFKGERESGEGEKLADVAAAHGGGGEGERDQERAERATRAVQERHAAPRREREPYRACGKPGEGILERDEVRDRECAERECAHAAEWVAPAPVEPHEGDCHRRPEHGNHVTAELRGYRHRQGRHARACHQRAVSVPPPPRAQEGEGDRAVGEGSEQQVEAVSVRRVPGVEESQAHRDVEGGMYEREQGGGRLPCPRRHVAPRAVDDAPGGNHREQEVRREGEQPRRKGGVGGEPHGDLRGREREGDEGQPCPCAIEGDRGRADKRQGEKGNRGRCGGGTEQGRCRECARQPVCRDHLRVRPHRHRCRHHRHKERPREAEGYGEEAEKARPGEQRNGKETRTHGGEDVTEKPFAPLEEARTRREERDPGGESGPDTHFGGDEATGVRETEEIDPGEQHGEAPDPREAAPAHRPLDVAPCPRRPCRPCRNGRRGNRGRAGRGRGRGGAGAGAGAALPVTAVAARVRQSNP